MDADEVLPVTLIDEDENFIIKLNQYWPHGLKTSEVEDNKNLLYLFSHKIPSAYTLCTCNLNRFEFRELRKMYEYEFDYGKFEVYEEKDLEFINKSNRKPVQILKFLEFPCCQVRLYHEEVDIYLCRAVRFFYQKKRISFYLDLKELEESKTIPANLVNDLNEKFSSLFRNGQIGRVQKKFKPGDTLNYDEAEIGNFALKLQDFQLRTISWMQAVELNIKLEKGSIQCRNDNSNQNLPNVKIQFGDMNFYIGLNGPFMLSRNPKTAKPYKAPVNGGFLAELPGVDSRGTILGMLHCSISIVSNNSTGVNATCINNKNFFISNANVIVCADPKTWIDSLNSCFPELKIIQFQLAQYSWKDIIEAEIIICTYEQLSILDLMKKFDWKAEEIILDEKGRGNLYHCKYRRIFFDSINEETMPLFKIFKKYKKILESDFKWGILDDCDELNSGLMDYFGFSGSLIEDPFTHNQFIKKFVRRHDVSHLLPEIIEETRFIPITTREKMMISRLKAMRNGEHYKQSVLDYFILSKQNDNLKVKDLKQVEEEICRETAKEIQSLELEIEKMNLNSSEIPRKLEKLSSLKSFQKFEEETFKSLREVENRKTCPICYDEIKDENFGILKCCHVFCYECVAWHVRNYGKCPLCSKEMGTVIPFTLDVKDNFEIEELSGLKIANNGSKMINIYLYILDLMKSTNDKAKIVLYVQYKNLEEYIHQFLNRLNIDHLRTDQGIDNQFAFQNDAFNIALICKEAFPKTLNLTAATHILLLHPFEDFKTELKGIRLIHRFGLDHPLKVVRFVAENTVEEEQFKENEKSK